MKSLIAILIIFSFLFQSFSKFAIIINYQINKEYIAKNLCIKKDEPENCCEGKCHLNKQLEEEDKKTEELPNIIKDKFEKEQYCQSDGKFYLFGTCDVLMNEFKTVSLTKIPHTIFHPPPAALFTV